MKDRNQDFLLGLTTIAIAALLVGSILFLYPQIKPGGQRLTIHFSHEEGMAPLKKGSPVLLSGSLQVGTVQEIRIEPIREPDQPGRKPRTVFVVVADIEPNLAIWGDCKITTDQPAVGGGGSVVILSVGTVGVALKQPVKGLPPQSFAATISTLSRRLLEPGGMVDRLDRMFDAEAEGSLLNKVMLSVSDLNAITASLRTQLSEEERRTLMSKLHSLMDDLNAATSALRQQTDASDGTSMLAKTHVAIDRLAAGLGELSNLLHDNRPAIDETMQHVNSAARQIDEQLLAAFRAEFNRDDSASLLGKLHASMDLVNSSLADLQAISGEGRKLFTLSRPALDRTVANVKDLSEQMRLAVQELRAAPWRLLYQPTDAEKRRREVLDTARMFAEAATYLDDAAVRLETVTVAAGNSETALAAGEDIQAIRESLRTAFERFSLAEKHLYERLK
jgi:ABC-type transporter Mla subunit MlaD